MKKKLLISGISLLLVLLMLGSVGLTVAHQVGVAFPEVGEHFDATLRKFMLNVDAGEGGTVNRQSGEFEEGSLVDLEATPDEGYMFAGWYSDKDVFLSTSSIYSLTMDDDTTLRARFCLKPEDMSATTTKMDNLRNCSEDFTFTVSCDRDDAETYLMENLKIVDADFVGTEYEDLTTRDFELVALGNNEYQVTLKGDETYERGVSYQAVLPSTTQVETNENGEEQEVEVPEDACFTALGTETATLDFSIEHTETNVVEQKNEVVNILHDGGTNDPVIQLVDDGLFEGEEGDRADVLVLMDLSGLDVGDIFCLYDGTVDENGAPVLNENTMYGKVLDVQELDGVFHVTYGMPDLAEIFSDLDASYSGDVDLEAAGATIDEAALTEQIRDMLYHDVSFHDSIAQIEAAAAICAEEYGYDVEMIALKKLKDMLDIKVKPKIRGNTAGVDLAVSLNIPITKNKQQVAQLSIQFTNQYEVSFEAYASLKLRYAWFIPTGINSFDAGVVNNVRSSQSIRIGIAYDQGTEGSVKELDAFLEKQALKMLKEGKIKDTLAYANASSLMRNAGFLPTDNTLTLRFIDFRIRFNIFTFNITAELILDFDISGSFIASQTSQQYTNVGVRKGANGMQMYNNQSVSSSANNIAFAGSVSARFGVQANAFLSVVGLSKYIQLGVYAGAGVLHNVEGMVSVNHGVWAGNYRVGAYTKAGAYYKLFSLQGTFADVEKEWLLFQLGYQNAIIGYVEQADLTDSTMVELGLEKNGLNLLNCSALKVNKMNTSNGVIKAQSLKPSSKDYQLSVKLEAGSNLTYDKKSGMLKPRTGAPGYFEEIVTVEVKSNSVWTGLTDAQSCFVRLPSVKIIIVYGDEDAYYASIDSKMEAAYRKLFREYKSSNVDVLKAEFNQLTANAISGEQYTGIYNRIINVYMDYLFGRINQMKKQEDDKRTMENKFVAVEPDAFENTLAAFNAMISENHLTATQLDAAMENTLVSEVMYQTLIDVSDDGDIQDFAEQTGVLNEEERAEMLKVISDFEARHRDNSRTPSLAQAFRVLLNLD